MTKRTFSVIILIILMGVVGAMTLLGTNGSILIYAMLESLITWKDLIGLGFAIGITAMFLPKIKSLFGF